MKTIELDIVEVNIHSGPLGINVSGGADSAILLFILMSNMGKDIPLHIFTCCSKKKLRTSAHHALDVVAKCIDLTGKENVNIHTNMVDKQTIPSLLEIPMSFIDMGKISYLYTGVTSLPPPCVYETFGNKTPLIEERDPGKVKQFYYGSRGEIYKPFVNINKKDIFYLYQKLARLDDLFPLTRSCESLTIGSGHCGECWWCEERFWAFGRYS